MANLIQRGGYHIDNLSLHWLGIMGIKGMRSRRGKGELYDEVKTENVILLLTKQGRELLDAKVNEYRTPEGKKVSRSEYVERWARDLL